MIFRHSFFMLENKHAWVKEGKSACIQKFSWWKLSCNWKKGIYLHIFFRCRERWENYSENVSLSMKRTFFFLSRRVNEQFKTTKCGLRKRSIISTRNSIFYQPLLQPQNKRKSKISSRRLSLAFSHEKIVKFLYSTMTFVEKKGFNWITSKINITCRM